MGAAKQGLLDDEDARRTTFTGTCSACGEPIPCEGKVWTDTGALDTLCSDCEDGLSKPG